MLTLATSVVIVLTPDGVVAVVVNEVGVDVERSLLLLLMLTGIFDVINNFSSFGSRKRLYDR